MIRVQDILASPMFAGFRMVSGYNGISNAVSQAGFLDWETGSDLKKNFAKGEFVVTTLAVSKDDPAYAESCLRVLIQHQVSAIAIKDIYFHEISDALRKYSDERNVPILFFSDTYIDDILFYIKSAILKTDFSGHSQTIKKLLFDESLGTQDVKKYALRLNPFFYEHVVFCAFLSPKENNPELASAEALGSHNFGNFEESAVIMSTALSRSSNSNTPNYRYTFLPFNHGFFHICTSDVAVDAIGAGVGKASAEADVEQTAKFPLAFLEKVLPHASENYHIGLQTEPVLIDDLAKSLRKSFFANISSCIDEQDVCMYENTGIDRLLFPLCRSAQLRTYYDDLLQRLYSMSKTPEQLISTLEVYAKCGGDVNITAQETYQHSNTIRYRLQKIGKAWGCENTNIGFDSQAFVFFRLHRMYQLISPLLTE